VTWITEIALDPIDMNVGLTCTRRFVSTSNDNFTWYLMVVNIWRVAWLERNLCLPDCLEAGESLRVNDLTHCWMYPLILRTKICYYPSCSCYIFLLDVTLVTSFLCKSGFAVYFSIPCNISANSIFWTLYFVSDQTVVIFWGVIRGQLNGSSVTF
jgi:hypothetical protein